jgi:hypothetical protein
MPKQKKRKKPISIYPSAAKPKLKKKVATKPKTKPKRKSDHPHSSHTWGPSYNKFMHMNEVNVVRRKPKEI